MTVETHKGTCENCGEVESDDGEFEFDHGPLCPNCGTVLTSAWKTESPNPSQIESDTTVSDIIDGDLR